MATTSTTTTTTTVYHATGKKPMRAFIRYDGMGRAISGSVILARKMPKVGKWREIDAYTCCQPVHTTSTTTTILR